MIRFHLSMRMPQELWSWFGVLAFLVLGMGGGHAAVAQNADVQALLEQGREAGADGEQMKVVVERARRAGLNADVTASLLRPAVELAEQDLPAAPLLSKTLEGLAKQVPPARMQRVLQQYRTYTETAGRLVTEWTQRSEVQQLLREADGEPGTDAQRKARDRMVTAVAKARQQDVPVEEVEAFLNDLPTGLERRSVSLDEVAAAVNVLPDLPASGASPEASRQLLIAALDAGYSPEALRRLPSALQTARRKSKQPVDALARGTARAIAQGTPATEVLQGLFQGSFPGGGPPAGVGEGPPGNGPGTGKPPDPGPPDDKGPPGGVGPPDDPGGG